MAQENGVVMKPNYRKIARVVRAPRSPYFLDSLAARFDRIDTTLTVDHFRCLYYGQGADTLYTLRGTYRRYTALVRLHGAESRSAGIAWWQYQMLLTAVWSTGDASQRKPLWLKDYDDYLFFLVHEAPEASDRRMRRCGGTLRLSHAIGGGLRWHYRCPRR